jgi:hypothetical protein
LPRDRIGQIDYFRNLVGKPEANLAELRTGELRRTPLLAT